MVDMLTKYLDLVECFFFLPFNVSSLFTSQMTNNVNMHRYGPVWISTTLVFMLAALGNFATYTIQKRSDPSMSWNFDVGFVNWAALVIYGYVIVVPAALFFLLQYFGINSSLIRLWCIWGYSLFIFIPASVSICPVYSMCKIAICIDYTFLLLCNPRFYWATIKFRCMIVCIININNIQDV